MLPGGGMAAPGAAPPNPLEFDSPLPGGPFTHNSACAREIGIMGAAPRPAAPNWEVMGMRTAASRYRLDDETLLRVKELRKLWESEEGKKLSDAEVIRRCVRSTHNFNLLPRGIPEAGDGEDDEDEEEEEEEEEAEEDPMVRRTIAQLKALCTESYVVNCDGCGERNLCPVEQGNTKCTKCGRAIRVNPGKRVT